MGIEDTGSATATEATTSEAATSTDAGLTTSTGETTTEGTSSEPGSQPAWKPTFKYKVYDKEKEIPEHFRAFITDADKEKAFRELFEKADGLDHQKPIHQQVVKERNQLNQHLQQVTQQHQTAVEGIRRIHHLSQTDLDTFFEVYKIPEQKIFDWAAQKLRMEELPPEVQARMRQDAQARRQSYVHQDQLQQLERQNQQLMVQNHQTAMTQTLAHPEVKDFASKFDQVYGQGAFQKQVNDYGDLHFRRNKGQYLPPWQAAQAVIAQWKPGFSVPQPPQAATPQPGSAPGPEAGAAPATIPNVGSGHSASSPTKPRFKSIDQLRRYAAEVTQER